MLRRLVLAILAATVLSACAGGDYSIAVRNVTEVELSDAYVSFEGFKSVSGHIPPGVYKITHYEGGSLPMTATVEWREPNGALHRRVVDVRKVVPQEFEGTVFFDILPEGEVVVAAREDWPPLPPQP